MKVYSNEILIENKAHIKFSSIQVMIDPDFTQVAPICFGEILSSLPLTSNNGISGTWSPAMINTQTTTYTFTPNAGQNANTATMTIVVNPKPIVQFGADPYPICAGTNTILSASTGNSAPTTLTYGIDSVINMLNASFGSTISLPLAAILVDTQSTGCAAFVAGSLSGKIALVERGSCPFVNKAQNAQDAGAVGLIIYNNQGGSIAPGGTDNGITIPVFGITQDNGLTLINAMINDELPVTILPPPVLSFLWSNGQTTSSIDTGVLNESTIFSVTVTNSVTGCSVTSSLNAAVSEVIPTFAQVAPICFGETLAALPTTSTNPTSIDGFWSPALNANQTTTYTFTPIPVSGQCLTSTTMTIDVISPSNTNNTTTINNNVITASQANATYQWIDCNNANTPIFGATSQSFTPVTNGSYAVQISLNNCPAVTSACTTITNLSSTSFENGLSVRLFPNPGNGFFNLELPTDLYIELYNNMGQLILSENRSSGKNVLNLSERNSGVYFLKIKNENELLTYKLVKN